MKKIFNKKRVLIVILLVIVSIGFAFITRELNITNVFNVKRQQFAVSVKDAREIYSGEFYNGNVERYDNDSDNVYDYVQASVSLAEPGDSMQIFMALQNVGTMEAMYKDYTINYSMPEYEDIITTKVEYIDGVTPKAGDLLRIQSIDAFKVTIEYKEDIENEELIPDSINLDIEVFINYERANDSATRRSYNYAHMKEITDEDSVFGDTRLTKDVIEAIDFYYDYELDDGYMNASTYSWDLSVEGDKSVMAYAYLSGYANGDSTFTIYIVSPKNIAYAGNNEDLFKGYNCNEINVFNFGTEGEYIDYSYLFKNVNASTIRVNSGFLPIGSTSHMFEGANMIGSEIIGDFKETTDMSYMYANVVSETEFSSVIDDYDEVYNLVDLENVRTTSHMFYNVNSEYIYTADNYVFKNLEDASSMFEGCSHLINAGFETLHDPFKGIKNISNMYKGCSTLASVGVLNADYSTLTNSTGIFDGCTNLRIVAFDFRLARDTFVEKVQVPDGAQVELYE